MKLAWSVIAVMLVIELYLLGCKWCDRQAKKRENKVIKWLKEDIKDSMFDKEVLIIAAFAYLALC